MLHKRKRHDPKPIWAIREGEALEAHHQDQRLLRQQNPPPSTTPQMQPRALDSTSAQSNGHLPPPKPNKRELTAFERPITDDSEVYDEVTRQVCNFIWANITNETIRRITAEDPLTELEIEARWGQITDRGLNSRLRGIHQTECVVSVDGTKFESTMSLEQHKKMNQFLNAEVQKSRAPASGRAVVDYKHTKEVDIFYELSQQGFEMLHPLVQQEILSSKTKQRVRVTKDIKTGEVIRKIIKLRIQNMEISSPRTEWDYRIGINLEINYPGPIDNLDRAAENGRPTEERTKDRMSYSWLSAFQLDLTQVTQGPNKNHELELEVKTQLLLEAVENMRRDQPSNYESVVAGMVNNLRLLSREITPPRQL